MPENQIQVKLNPDVTPSGSDLSIVNAARKSFNSRSEWEVISVSEEEYEAGGFEDWEVADSFFEPYMGVDLRRLKPKDKRLREFLARGMSVDDFDNLVDEVSSLGHSSIANNEAGEEVSQQLIKKDLIKVLWEWRNTPTHDTPFNHTFISFEVKAPLFVARQLVKHEYLIWSEASGRYIENMEFYRPDVWRGQPENKKQGSTGKATSQYHPNLYCQDVEDLYIEKFRKMVDTQNVCMEQARMLAPNTLIVEWTWSGTLGAFAKMCQLRLHPEAQYESRLVARQVYQFLKEYYPLSAKALVEGPDV